MRKTIIIISIMCVVAACSAPKTDSREIIPLADATISTPEIQEDIVEKVIQKLDSIERKIDKKWKK